jgi:hypothetical protein
MNKMNNIFQKRNSNLLTLVMSTLFIMSMMSCSSDKYNEDPYFYIEDQMSAVSVDASGILQANRKAYTIRSNRPWAITQEKTTDWLHVFADEGEDDGIFDIWIDKNPNFTSRTGNLIFKVDGQEQPVMFRVDQKADVPGVTIVNAAAGYTVLGRSTILKVPVTNNVKWEASLSASDWAAIDSVGKDTVYIKTQINDTNDPRCVTLKVVGTGSYSSLSSQTIITQSTVGIIINEHFDWMQEGVVDSLYNYPEVNSTGWSTVEKNYGWTTLGVSMYGGRGYLKVGKTNYGGDLVSPVFSSIEGTKDLIVTFKSIGYISVGGTKDDGVLNIAIAGDGFISDHSTKNMKINNKDYNVATFNITVYPNSKNQENGAAYDAWGQPGAKFSFKIKGATAKTQIIFVGGSAWGDALKNIGQSKNRCYFDDIIVKLDE